jgi:riboflavin kinase/FMN adenylyltransferase
MDFQYKGKVIPGTQQGRKLNMRTANLEIIEGDLSKLKFGVYATIVRIDKKLYKSITHYGPRMVFSEENPQFEVHIFDFDKDIYGEKIDVEIVEFIRETVKFYSTEKMMEQIQDDFNKAHVILANFQL